MTDYFQSLFSQLTDQGVRASVSGLQIKNVPLREYVTKHLSRKMGESGSLLGDPIFEATFPWESGDITMKELAGKLLNPSLVKALDNPPKKHYEEYRFPIDRAPYKHQIKSWDLLSRREKHSIVVTSGTGSGKTECFLIPILNDLANEFQESKETPLEGVRALFLYPLNALINSQKDRLSAWTNNYGDGLRYCLYNGITPERNPRNITLPRNIVGSRQQLRLSPPPILVTNATMLEYMLVRTQDQPILEKSKGQLRWIVLDEAHTYLGSQAAELSLLLRRVMHAFDVDSSEVRFVATSATIGGEEGNEQLREFLAQMAGVPVEQVTVVGGNRKVPPLPEIPERYRNLNLSKIAESNEEGADPDSNFFQVAGREDFKRLRRSITDSASSKPIRALSEIRGVLFGDLKSDSPTLEKALEILDLCSSTSRVLEDGSVENFLPLRVHVFGRTIGGLWACTNKKCTHKTSILQNPDWGYGQVYFARRDYCECGAPVLELVSCNECNTTHLLGKIDGNGAVKPLSDSDDIDDFARHLDPIDEDEDDDEMSSVDIEAQPQGEERVLVLANPSRLGVVDTLNEKGQRGAPVTEQSFSVNLYLADDGDMRCPNCETKEVMSRSLFMRKILGAPFQLSTNLPLILEFGPPKKDAFEHPFDGRRMITFTDSRQGTARIAANLQMDSERNFLRSHVYQTLIASSGSSGSSELDDARKTIKEIDAALKSTGLPKSVREIMKSTKQASMNIVAASQARSPISWEDMASKLATSSTQLKRWILSHYKEIDSVEFGGTRGQQSLAELLLAREFIRRPKKQNSLESMGLVQLFYPALEFRVKKVPLTASSIGVELDDWKDLLKLLLDWHVRSNQAVSHQHFWPRWIGHRMPFKTLASPKQREAIRGVVLWPAVRGSQDYNRFVRMLREVYKVDPSTIRGKDTIESVFDEAWQSLQIDAGILKPVEDGRFHLDFFTDVAFRIQEKAWICPITQRFLDTTLKGISPFIPPRSKPMEFNCEQVSMPVPSTAFAEKDVSLTWIRENPGVIDLRRRGLWSNLHDRVVIGTRYYSVAEHSAQQPASKLRGLELDFKKGNLNVLSCSTTMEMGVDIGGISVVAMNNVPPNPANYLQRAGRAGRRGETHAISYTLCKDNPHGHQVLNDTRWPFDTPIPLPKVSLESASIVQRHVNSFLLSEFLRKATAAEDVNLLRLNCEWFYLAENSDDSPCQSMVDWCEFGEDRTSLDSSLKKLVAKSVLEGRSSFLLFRDTSEHLKRIEKKWRNDYQGYEQQLTQLSKGSLQSDTSRAIKAVEIGMHRLKMEYLLGELATQGFLPGYGFPTGVVSLNTITAEQLAKMESERQREKENGELTHREDNRSLSRNFPSRSRATAIREYAPGADIVIDGLVYQSSGISLSWQRPMTERQAKEPQGFFYSWQCRKCGSAGTTPSRDIANHCDKCGSEIKASEIHICMQPNGFCVDISWNTHNDITRPHYLPVEQPKVSADGEWIPLVQESLGRFRTTTEGQVLYTNSGKNGTGYAVCLECGRSADMPSNLAELPALFKTPHRRMRGGKVDGSNECSASHDSWKIKPGVYLAHRDMTDVFELQLKNIDSKRYLQDNKVATTLAVSLRQAAALKLGISQEELGYAVQHVEIEGGRTWSILLFDTADGGAGYASSLGRHIVDIGSGMFDGLQCEAKCDKVCHHCLLTFETQHQVALLDRIAAKDWLTESYKNSLVLPSAMQILGITSRQETVPLYQAIENALQKPSAKGVRVYLGGRSENWNTAWGELKQRLASWVARSLKVEIVLYKDTFDELGEELLTHLAVLSQGLDIPLCVLDHRDQLVKGLLIAEVETTEFIRWACEDVVVTELGPSWGKVSENPLIVAASQKSHVSSSSVDVATVLASQSSIPQTDVEMEIETELDGNGSQFGEKFWGVLLEKHEGLKGLLEGDIIDSIEYSDRYLKSPLTVSLLLFALKELDTRYPDCYQRATTKIKLEEITRENKWHSRSVWDDWSDERLRERSISEAFEYVDLQVRVGSYARVHMAHSRALLIKFESGKLVRIRLDEGWGYWETQAGPGSQFNFSASPQQQGERIAEWSGLLVKRRKRYKTSLVVSIREMK